MADFLDLLELLARRDDRRLGPESCEDVARLRAESVG